MTLLENREKTGSKFTEPAGFLRANSASPCLLDGPESAANRQYPALVDAQGSISDNLKKKHVKPMDSPTV